MFAISLARVSLFCTSPTRTRLINWSLEIGEEFALTTLEIELLPQWLVLVITVPSRSHAYLAHEKEMFWKKWHFVLQLSQGQTTIRFNDSHASFIGLLHQTISDHRPTNVFLLKRTDKEMQMMCAELFQRQVFDWPRKRSQFSPQCRKLLANNYRLFPFIGKLPWESFQGNQVKWSFGFQRRAWEWRFHFEPSVAKLYFFDFTTFAFSQNDHACFTSSYTASGFTSFWHFFSVLSLGQQKSDARTFFNGSSSTGPDINLRTYPIFSAFINTE